MDKDNPVISIIMPAWNVESLINSAIESAVNQIFDRPYEMLIYDDGSTDKTWDSIHAWRELVNNSHKYLTIKPISCKINRGPGYARKVCIARSKSNLICYLDADDAMFQTRLIWAFDYFKSHPGIDILLNPYVIYQDKDKDD